MRPVKAMIVDDEEFARRRIRGLLASESDVEVVRECEDGRSAVVAIAAERPDLLFLDIQMPEINGFQVLEQAGAGRVPAVLFVTAYDHYALQAFEAHGLDYLLKPFTSARFHSALQRARQQIEMRQQKNVEEKLNALLGEVGERASYLDRLAIRCGDRVLIRATEDVAWFEADSNYVRVHIGKETHVMRESLSDLERSLDPKKFVRIHRSSIVNVEFIRELHSQVSGDYMVVLCDGATLPVGRNYRDHFRNVVGRAR